MKSGAPSAPTARAEVAGRVNRRKRGCAAARRVFVLPLLALVACGSGSGNPFASLESRCASLPSARFEVVQVPASYTEDDSRSIDELTLRSGSSPTTHRTSGLTIVSFGHRTKIELRSVEDRRGAQACGTPAVRVELSMQPMTVFIARELADLPCQHTATLEHELKHVAVYGEALDDAARDLASELPAAVGSGLRKASSQAELEQQFDAAVRDYLADFMHRHQRMLTEHQAEVDSPEEYARVSNACRQ